ncbi:MAG TPA: hypothetical protein QGH10_10245, partial [Armatimonadota bacterium]|nr:hypothetical protein [Armatimonadota bacterium]
MTTPISLAASLFLAVASPAPAQQPIESHNPFEREMGRGLALDQEHLGTDVIGGSLSCQVFTPLAGRLERLDIVTKNRTDPSPGDIRLWEWHGSYETTVAGEPVWEDSLQFSGQDSPYVRHYFPRVDVEPGEQYMIECSRPSEGFYVAGSQTDEYADGFMIAGGRERPDWDMWFSTFGPGEDEALQPLALPEMPDVTPTLPRPPAEVTRDVYLDTVSTYVERTYEHWESERGRRASELMYYCGFLYRFADDARWSERVSLWLADAKTYLDENETFGGSPWYVDQMGLGILWLRGCEHWDDGVEALARDVMLAATRRLMETPERGAMNRTVWDVHGARLASDLFPNSPEAAEWRAYSDEAWRDWADFDDTEEDSSHYNAVFLHFMLAHLHVTDRQDIFKRPGMRALVDRWRETIPPAGMMVGWGDSVGMGADWGAWVAAFETASTATGDGTYKWAAHRLLDGHRRRYLDDDPLQQGYEDMRSVPLAYIGADDSITPVEPAP